MIEYQSRPLYAPVDRSGAKAFFVRAAAAVGWFLLGVVLLGGLAILWMPSPLLLTAAVALGLLVVTMLAAQAAIFRRRIAVAVLEHVQTALSLQLPLPGYLQAAASGEVGWSLRRRLRHLAGELERGVPLSVTMVRVAGELPRSTLDRLQSAEEAAALPRVVDDLVRRAHRAEAAIADARQSLGYVVVLFIVLQAVVLGLLVFVVPKYAEIFRDFGIKLPWAMQVLVNLPLVLTVPMAVLLVPVLIVTLTRATRGLFRTRPMRLRRGRWFDGITWYLPVAGRLVRAGAAADASAVMADWLHARRPLPEAVNAARGADLNRVLDRRLERFYARIILGEPPSAAADAERLPTLMSAAFAVGSSGELAGALEFAARAYAATTQRLAIFLKALAPVLLTLVFGVLIGFVALGLLQPLVVLVESISGQVFR